MRFSLLLLLTAVTGLFSQAPYRMVENTIFGPGETFVFDIKYGFLPGGTARLEIADTLRVNGSLCHQIRAITTSNATVSVFYQVRDTNVSYMDVTGLYSHGIRKYIHEGSYIRNKVTVMDPVRGIAITDGKEYAAAPFVQDALSAFYYFRLLAVEDSIDINCFDDKKNYPLRIYVRKHETIKTPLGKFRCRRLQPALTTSGIFLKNGEMSLWMTDDFKRLPVKLQFKIPYLGNITCNLIEYRPGLLINQ